MNSQDQNLLFEKFRILETIKQDLHRNIYIAEHIFLNKKIFLKTINKKNLSDTVQMDRFIREAQILAKLDHPNIIKVWDFGTYEDSFYISFEYFKNQNLREVLNQRKLNEEEKKKLILQLMTGLQYAHDQQIIHRDLKPENILLDEQLLLKIADFGLAAIENQAGSTEDTTIVGTPAYMSPEQIQGQELTVQSDLFSLGIIIYEIYCGKNLFLGADTGATLNNILNSNSKLINDKLEKLPADIKDLLKQLLSKYIHKRPRQINFPDIKVLPEINDVGPEKTHPIKRNVIKLWIAATVFSIIVITLYFSYAPIQKIPKNKSKQSDLELSAADNVDSIKSESIKDIIKNDKSDADEPFTQVKMNNVPGKDNRSEQLLIVEPFNKDTMRLGFLMIDCQPWADIYIDDVKRESTPLKNPLQLTAGEHQLKLVHPEYPYYEKSIQLNPEESYHISVNLDTTIGYFSCHVHPWGEVTIDGKLIGQTPLKNYIRLEAGEHSMLIKNPGYSDYHKTFQIHKNDTVSFNIDLGKRNITRTADSS